MISSRLKTSRLNKKRPQQGGALVWLVSLLFIFMLTALVVDGGRLYFEKQQLQAMANNLATSLANEGQACYGTRMAAGSPAISTADNTLEDLYPESNVEVVFADLAIIESDGEKHQVFRSDDVTRSNGVSVKLSRNIDGLLAFVVDEPLTAGASAKKEVVSGIQIDSRTGTLDTTSSALLNLIFGEILGADLSLSLVGLNDLSGLVTDLSGLVVALGLDNVINALPADEVLEAVLGTTAALTGPAVSVLDEIVDAAVGNNIDLTDVIEALGDSTVPPGASVPTLDLVAAIITNVDDALPKTIELDLDEASGIPILSDLISLLGLSDTKLSLSIAATPGFVLAAARTNEDGDWPTAQSSDVSISIETRAGLGIIDVLDLSLYLATGSAEVEIESSACASGSNNFIEHITVRSVSTSLLTLDADVDLIKILGFPLVSVKFEPITRVGGIINDSFEDVDLDFYDETSPKLKVEFGGTDVALDGLLEDLLVGAEVCIMGLCTGSTVSNLLSDLGAIIDGLLGGLVAPLLQALGINLVPVDVTLDSVNQNMLLIEDAYE